MSTSRLRCVAMAALFVCGTAFAAPFASVASVAPVGQTVTLAGGGFAPGTVVTVQINGPRKSVSMAAVVVADDGSISHDLVAPAPGTYNIKLMDASGRALAQRLRLVASR